MVMPEPTGGVRTANAHRVTVVRDGKPGPLPILAQTTQQGVRLSLAMARGPYPWTAIVPAIARVQNVSHQPVKLGYNGDLWPCGGVGPAILVERMTTERVFPPAIPGGL